jgi:hypothetical protein
MYLICSLVSVRPLIRGNAGFCVADLGIRGRFAGLARPSLRPWSNCILVAEANEIALNARLKQALRLALSYTNGNEKTVLTGRDAIGPEVHPSCVTIDLSTILSTN